MSNDWQTYPDPTALAVDVIGESLNGSTAWTAFTGWNGAGSAPALDVPVGDRRPDGAGEFVLVWLNDTPDAVEGGFVQAPLLEVEAWAGDSRAAWRLIMAAYRALRSAHGTRRPMVTDNGEVRTRSVRSVVRESGPGNLPPGEEGWERFRMAVSIRLSTRS